MWRYSQLHSVCGTRGRARPPGRQSTGTKGSAAHHHTSSYALPWASKSQHRETKSSKSLAFLLFLKRHHRVALPCPSVPELSRYILRNSATEDEHLHSPGSSSRQQALQPAELSKENSCWTPGSASRRQHTLAEVRHNSRRLASVTPDRSTNCHTQIGGSQECQVQRNCKKLNRESSALKRSLTHL